LKLLKENIKETLHDLGTGNNFLNQTLIVQEIVVKIDKWDCIKVKSFCTAITRVKRHNKSYIMVEKFCQLFIWQGINIQNM
jgi:glycine cleavage system regulatory protein